MFVGAAEASASYSLYRDGRGEANMIPEEVSNAVLGKMLGLPIRSKVVIAAKAGLDISGVPAVENNALVNPAIARAFGRLNDDAKQRATTVMATEVASRGATDQCELTQLLGQHGYGYANGSFVPVGLIDEREKQFLPSSSAEQISTAIHRLSNGDENGAITSACGAVDTATIAIYQNQNWGPPPDSFQAKVNTVIGRFKIFAEMEKELSEIGVNVEDAKEITKELQEATKHAANALQVIRRTLGDVHGKRPTYRRLSYDSIKFASAICALFEGRI